MTSVCTVHATDSFITERLTNDTYKVREKQRSKIVRVPHWRGAMSYWGLAEFGRDNWSTLRWLQEGAQQASSFPSPETFAEAMAPALDAELSKMKIAGSTERGIGIHFTAYERIDGYWIPELFLISNWSDASYRAVRGAIAVTRETFYTVSEQPPQEDHREPEHRLLVYKFLRDGKILWYNNGDPALYNPAAHALFTMFQQLANRGVLCDPNTIETWIALTRRPVEIVSEAQRDFCPEGHRLVGGKPHDLAVTPNGEYVSTTGD
jgi:hypothetical protein